MTDSSKQHVNLLLKIILSIIGFINAWALTRVLTHDSAIGELNGQVSLVSQEVQTHHENIRDHEHRIREIERTRP